MIFKLECKNTDNVLEVRTQGKSATFFIFDEDDKDGGYDVTITAKQLYQLIGSMHIMHKEVMEEIKASK